MSVLDRKLRRELLAQRGLLVSITAIVALGVACFVSMCASYLNLLAERDGYYRDGRMAHFWIDMVRMPRADIDRLAHMPGIARMQMRITYPVTIELEGVVEPMSGRVLSLPDPGLAAINDIVIRSGRRPEPGDRTGVMVGEAFARARGLNVGDRITLLMGGNRHELRITGTAQSCEFVYLMAPGGLLPDPKRHGLFYISRELAEDAFDMRGAANQIIGRVLPRHGEYPDAVIDPLRPLLSPYGLLSVTPRRHQPSHRFLQDELDGLIAFAVVAPLLFLGVAVLVINVKMTRLVQQQRPIIGTLKSLGYSDGQVVWHYVKFGLLIGALGGAMGVAGGQLLADWLAVVYLAYFEFPQIESRFHPVLAAVGMGFSLGATAVGTLRGARAALRLTPADALRTSPPLKVRRTLLERWPWLWRRLGVDWQNTLRNLSRSHMRAVSGGGAATTGVAMIVLALVYTDSLNELVELQYEHVMLSDIDLTLRDFAGPRAVLDAANLPGVQRVEPLLVVAGTLESGHRRREVALTGLTEANRLTQAIDRQGRRIEPPKRGLLMPRWLAERLELQPGDSVTFTPARGDRRPQRLTVARTFESFVGEAIYIHRDQLQRMLGSGAAVSTVQLRLEPGAANDERLFDALNKLPQVEAIGDVQRQKELLEQHMVGALRIFAAFLTGFAAVIFFGSIMTAGYIAIAERQREIATLRALGYGPWAVGMLLLREAMLLNITGALIGLVLGYYLAEASLQIVATELVRVPAVLHVRSMVIAVMLAVAFTFIAHLLVQRRINRMDWLEALKVKE